MFHFRFYLAVGFIFYLLPCSKASAIDTATIRSLIFSDLILLNQVYAYDLIDTNLRVVTIAGNDTLTSIGFNNLKSENHIMITSIEEENNFFRVAVTFANLGVLWMGANNEQFEYILLMEPNRTLRINGFMVSEVLLLSPQEKHLLNNTHFIKGQFPSKAIVSSKKAIKNLKISLLEKVNFWGTEKYFYPLLRTHNTFCIRCLN